MWLKKFVLIDDDEDIETYGDINIDKRLFTVTQVKDFVKTSLDNYYGMFGDDDEFNDYEIENNADPSMFTLGFMVKNKENKLQVLEDLD